MFRVVQTEAGRGDLEAGLGRARVTLRRDAVRRSAWRAGSDATTILLVGSIGCATAIVAARGGWVPRPAAVACGGLVVAAAALSVVRHVLPALLHVPASEEAAERLDAATTTGNPIATALDLARADEASPFARLAIGHGARHLRAFELARPLLPDLNTVPVSLAWRAGVAALVVGSAVWFPLRAGRGRLAFAGPPTAAPAGRLDGVVDGGRTPRTGEVPTTPRRPDEGDVATPADGGVGADASASSPSSADAQPGGGSAPSAAPAQGAGASNARSAGSPGSPAAAAGGTPLPEDRTGSPASRNKPPSAEPLGPHPTPAQSAGGASASADSGGSNAPAPPVAGLGQAGSSKAAATAGRRGADATDRGGRSLGVGTARARGGDAGGGGGTGEGRGIGDPPKKSRGVAPLLLGTTLADHLQARELAGPDERQLVGMPPQSQPGDDLPARSNQDRHGDEPVVGGYRVPPAARGMVGDYFRQFHRDGGPPPG